MKLPLAERQTALRIRSAELRLEVAMQARVLHKPLAMADRVHDGWRWLGAHREWLWLAGGALALLRPRRTFRVPQRGWLGWRVVRRWTPWLSAALTALAARTPPEPGGPST